MADIGYGQSIPERTAPRELERGSNSTNGQRITRSAGQVPSTNGPLPKTLYSDKEPQGGSKIDA